MRLPLRRNDVVLGDRNDAKPQALAWIVAQGAHVIARFGWNALRWETLDGTPWNVLEAVRTLPDATPGQWVVPMRPSTDGPALTTTRRGTAEIPRRRGGQSPPDATSRATALPYRGAATLEAADYVLILTTLPDTVASATEILELYRLRWQIECAFKRCKSLLHCDPLRAFDPDLAQTYLLAKVLGALLIDAIRNPDRSFSPYGFPLKTDTQRRLALYPNGVE